MTQTMVYIACAKSQEILAFTLDTSTGELSLRQQLALAGEPHVLGLRPDKRVLFTGTRPDLKLVAFEIDQKTGELYPLGAAAAAGNPTFLACDRTQSLLFCASFGGNNLTVCPLDADGIPQTASQIEADLPRAHAAAVHSSNRWVLVPMLGADAIRVYKLADGRITPNDPALWQGRAGCGSRIARFTADERHVHCINERDGTIDVLAFDAERGILTPQQSISLMPPDFTEEPWAAELRLTPDERFLYATDRRSSVIALFSVAPETAQLTLIGHYPTETQPRGMNIDPSGRCLLVAGEQSNHISVYAIDPASGMLTVIQRHATGLNPLGVEFCTIG